jgi:hypothetical protein
MANDRIMLVCKRCKEWVSLTRFLTCDDWVTIGEDDLEKFIRKHLHDCQGRYGAGISLCGDPGFYLETESENKG